MPSFRVPNWILRRLNGRTTAEEIQEALNLDDDANINELFDNERLLFQFIMRRWMSDLEQDANNVNDDDNDNNDDNTSTTGPPIADPDNSLEEEPVGEQEQEQQPGLANNNNNEIPILNMDDVDLALRDHLIHSGNNNHVQRGTFWMIDFLAVTLFPMLFLRILKNVFSFISFSDDILEDTDNFLAYIQDNSFGTLAAQDNKTEVVKSLISKFGKIVYEEMIYYYSPNDPNPLLARYLTLFCFYIYTSLTSIFMMISFVFLLLCLTYTIGKRWSYIDKFLVNVSRDSNGVF